MSQTKENNDLLFYGALVAGSALVLFLLLKKPIKKISKPMENIEVIPKNSIRKEGDIIVSVPYTNFKQFEVLFVWGGINYATAEWMLKQMPVNILHRAIVVFANYNTPIEKLYKALNTTINSVTPPMVVKNISLFGFSAGGQRVWENASDKYKVLGVIDPTTYSKDAQRAAKNVVMTFNPSNWASLPKISSALPSVAAEVVKKGGTAENIKLAHKDFPKRFFETYEQKILA